jgi:hypothetical protein
VIVAFSAFIDSLSATEHQSTSHISTCHNILQTPSCLVARIFGCENRKDVTLKGTLNKTAYVPGEMIVATLEIANPKRLLIQYITLSILERHHIK